MKKPPYSAAELEVLRQLYPAAPMAEVQASLPGRTLAAICRQALKLGLRRVCRDFCIGWTEQEIALLRAHFPATPKPQLLALLPLRTWFALATQAARLRIARTEWHRLAWPKQNLEFLKAHYPSKGGTWVAAQLGLTRNQVSKAAERHGIKREWPAPTPRVRRPKPAKARVAKPKAAIHPKPLRAKAAKPAKVAAPKPPKPPREAPQAKALPLPGVQDNSRTPLLNALKATRQREATKLEKATDWLSDMKKLPGAHPARLAFTIGARNGLAAGKAAYFNALQQAA